MTVLYVESVVPEIQKIRVKTLPKRTIKGAYYLGGGIPRALFVTRNDTVYTPYRTIWPIRRRADSSTASKDWVKSFYMAGLITEQQMNQHNEDIDALSQKHWHDKRVDEFLEMGDKLNFKFTNKQIEELQWR